MSQTPPRSAMSEVILLDFWGVIGVVQSPESVAQMAGRLHVEVPAFSAAYWRYRDAHDAGGSADDFWADVAAELGADLDAEALAVLVDLDVRSWSGVHADMLDLVRELSAAGVRMALLSNAPRDLVDHAGAVLEGLVSPLLFSCELGSAKPGAAIYATALDRLGVAAQDVLFIDDNAANVRAAQAAGMQAFQHVSVADTRRALQSYLHRR